MGNLGHQDQQDPLGHLGKFWRLEEVTAQLYKDLLDPRAPEVCPAPRAQQVYLD